MKPKRQQIEHGIQKAFVEWFRLQFPRVLIYAIPNGGGRTEVEAGKLKAEGVLAGMPDLHIPRLKLWLEMKSPGRKPTPAQLAIHAYLRGIGDTVEVCDDIDAACQAVWQATAKHNKEKTCD